VSEYETPYTASSDTAPASSHGSPPPVPERYAFDAEEDGVVVYDRERSDAWIKSDHAVEVGRADSGGPTED
jgi:hypothetical protein